MAKAPKKTPEGTYERLVEVVAENLGVSEDEITLETSFTEDLGGDSLDIVELAMELKEEFGVELPDDQMEKLKTVGLVWDYIQKELTNRKQA